MRMELQGSGWYVNLSSGSTQAKTSMAVHQCARFFNNLRLVHERAIKK